MQTNKHFFLFILLSSLFSHGILLSVDQVTYSLRDGRGIPLDHKLIELFNRRDGLFIEAGAYDGINQSNTKLLEEFYGWKGVLIEPSEKAFSKLEANRPHSICFNCALGSFSENETYVFGDFNSDLMSSVNGVRLNRPAEQKAYMRSLQSILDQVGISHINLFVLDTEGYEFNILNGIDFTRTAFDYLLIEIYNCDFDKIVSFLSQKGYDLVENFSNLQLTVGWDGTHNDYLFKAKDF